MEWNQTYGRERPLPFGRCLTGEIIEIGAVRLSSEFKYEDVMKVYVRPRFYRKLHSMVKRLTGITQDVLEMSPDFPEAYEIFREFCTDDEEKIEEIKRRAELIGLTRLTNRAYRIGLPTAPSYLAAVSDLVDKVDKLTLN